jgi:hypothetical protein
MKRPYRGFCDGGPKFNEWAEGHSRVFDVASLCYPKYEAMCRELTLGRLTFMTPASMKEKRTKYVSAGYGTMVDPGRPASKGSTGTVTEQKPPSAPGTFVAIEYIHC